MLVRLPCDLERLTRDFLEGDRDRARAASFAACTMDARVAAGWPYKDEYDSDRSRERGIGDVT